MMRPFAVALALAAVLAAGLGTSASAQQGQSVSGPRQHIERQLPYYGFRDVDVSKLSTSQVVQIYTLMHSPRSQGDKARLIRSALGRGLTGTLFGRGG
jgi:hypothetical protein